jgi:hypothetical protein
LEKAPNLLNTTVQRADKMGYHGFNALHLAANNGRADVVGFLVTQYPDLIAACVSSDGELWSGFNVLHLAAARGQAGVVKCLLEKAPNLLNTTVQRADKMGYHGCNALHLAVINIRLDVGRLDVVKFLVNFAIEKGKRDFIATRILGENTGGWAHKTALELTRDQEKTVTVGKKSYTDIIEFLESKQ